MSFLFRKQSKEGKQKTEQQMYAGGNGPGTGFDLSGCDLYELPPGLYSQCKYLRKESLLLHTNNIGTLKAASSLGVMDALQVLDISKNKLKSLPDDIGDLSSLRELNISQNKLKALPSSLGKLSTLTTLLAQSNELEAIPGALGQCKRLKVINFTDNYNIVGLPRDLAHAQALEVIDVRYERFGFPPKSIMSEGVPAIMKFLCDSCGVPYEPAESTSTAAAAATSGSPRTSPNSLYPDLSAESAQSEALRRHSADQERRRSEQLALNQQSLVSQEQQALMSSSNSRRLELLKRVAEDQARQDAELVELQQRREDNQQKLIATVQQEEKTFSDAVAQKMKEAEKARNEDVKKALEQDQRMLERLSSMQQETEQLRRAEVLEGMERLLSKARHQELLTVALAMEKQKAGEQSIRELAAKADAQVQTVLQRQSEMQKNLLNELASQDVAQRLAFEALLLDKDEQHRKATSQIVVLQEELAKLSALERDRKAKEQSFNQAQLEEQRNQLTVQLRLLIDVQQERAEQLQQLLVQFEDERKSEEKDYWLRMYQRLMDSKPEALILEELSLEEQVVFVLRTAKASQFLTSFARNHVTFDMLSRMDDDDLRRLGVTSLGAREAILKCTAEEAAIEGRAREKAMVLLADLDEIEPGEKPAPSAPNPVPVVAYPAGPTAPVEDYPTQPACVEMYPPQSQPYPPQPQPYPLQPQPYPPGGFVGLPYTAISQPPATAPPDESARAVTPSASVSTAQLGECVVCLDRTSNCVLLNCGHVCSCYQCSVQLTSCPMCRAEISSVVQLYTA